MKYYSTNKQSELVTPREAVLQGLARDGGLYMPEHIPALPTGFVEALPNLSFQEIASTVAEPFLAPDISQKVLCDIVDKAFDFPAPLIKLHDTISLLELFHGPTLAFKDFGARFMARAMAHLIRGSNRMLTILVATSGDTGSAVAHGFYQIDQTRVVLLYPSGKVSDIQEKQLTTLGSNITALEIDGVFDDCQRLVKSAFVDEDLRSKLMLASANSINIARLIPQSFYYFSAFARRLYRELPSAFVIPSGNFGNITAGLMAKRMGLPIDQLIASTNANSTVPEYLDGKNYSPRPSITTLSNAMDVGEPSNFARMLDLYNNDRSKMRADITGYSFSDTDTLSAMRSVYNKYDYILDPHAAVGYLGAQRYNKEHENSDCIVLGTAHPAKFLEATEEANISNVSLPSALTACMNKKKTSIRMSSQFDSLKEFLLGLD